MPSVLQNFNRQKNPNFGYNVQVIDGVKIEFKTKFSKEPRGKVLTD